MSTFFKHCRSYCRAKFAGARGFTLVELLVVSAIILFITAFVLFQQGKFNSSTLLRSLTYSVALSVRQAQVYGTSVRESATGSGVFASGYGVYFASGLACPSGTTGNCYYIFSDNNNNGAYNSGEELPVYTLGRGYTFSNVCGRLSGTATLQCYSGTGSAINALTVFFRRPNPDACFASNLFPASCALGAVSSYSDAYIQLRSANGESRSIKVTATGQIAVCAPNLTDLTAC